MNLNDAPGSVRYFLHGYHVNDRVSLGWEIPIRLWLMGSFVGADWGDGLGEYPIVQDAAERIAEAMGDGDLSAHPDCHWAITSTDAGPRRWKHTWLDAAKITTGPIFRTRTRTRMWPRTVADIHKRWGAKAGYDVRQIGAHSSRRGGITTMHRNGAAIPDIMRASRHKTMSIVLGYIEAHEASGNPAIRALGL